MSKKEWNLDEVVEKVKPNIACSELSKEFNFNPKPILMDHEITDEMLSESYFIMAKIIRIHGEQYLPIFKRLQDEIEERIENKKLLDAALEISIKGFNPQGN